jgi:hypothetical protein
MHQKDYKMGRGDAARWQHGSPLWSLFSILKNDELLKGLSNGHKKGSTRTFFKHRLPYIRDINAKKGITPLPIDKLQQQDTTWADFETLEVAMYMPHAHAAIKKYLQFENSSHATYRLSHH